MKQADFVAGLMERYSQPIDQTRSGDARTGLSVTARAIGTGTLEYRDQSDLYQVQRFVTRAMQGISGHVLESEPRRAAFEVGHAATLIALGIALDKGTDDVIKALDIATHAADQLTQVVPAPSHQEPGHILPMSAAVGVAFLLGTDATRLSNAFGIASSMTLATRNPDRTGPLDAQLVAKCCANGTLAACLAGEGFTASPRGLEGARGWRASLGGGDPAGSIAEATLRPGTVLSAEASDGMPAGAEGGLREALPELASLIEREHANV